jgi:hypothetical protein
MIAEMPQRPNPRLQRTRRSPLSRQPLGAPRARPTSPYRPILRTVSFAAAFLISVAGLAQGTPGWRTFAPPGGGFSVLMPGTPTEDPTDGTATTFQMKTEDRPYVVTYAAIPPEWKGLTPDVLLADLRYKFVQAMRGEHVESRLSTLQGFPALTWTLDSALAGQPVFRMKMTAVVAGEKLFNVGLTVRKESFRDGEADKYLSSFRLDKAAK